MMRPTFTIAIANYNYALYVGEAIESALAQDYPPELFEVIVVDDGSTDASREVLERYRDRPGLQIRFQENRGQSSAFEAAVQVARFDYVCLLDSDDLYLPTKLAQVAARIEALGASPETLFLCHDLEIRDDAAGATLQHTWLQTMRADRYGESLDPSRLDSLYPFANPSGEVFGRPLIAAILQALPPWAFPRGTDTPVCMAAMLKTWRIDYLHQCLSIYRVHGKNEVGRVVDGRYSVGLRWRTRTPRLLSFLERWVDTLPLEGEDRSKRISCLQKIERMSRVPAPSRGTSPPLVSIALLGDSPESIAHSAQSILDQYHPRLELLAPSGLMPRDDAASNVAIVPFGAEPMEDEFAQMAAAYRAARGDYIVFVRQGDRLDRGFVEQHLLLRLHGALVGVSCSDVRLVSPRNTLIHADVFANSGAWKQPLQQVPPLATGLKDWIFSSVSACMLRRTALLDRLVDPAQRLTPALRAAGLWLPLQLQHHTAGVLRIRETLSSSVIGDGAGASYGYVSAPSNANGTIVQPPVRDACEWFADFYRSEHALFAAWLPATWHQRFKAWLNQQSEAIK